MRTKNTDQWKQGLQQVVAVRPAADDMQEQVEFGGCGAGQFHSTNFIAEINSSLAPLVPLLFQKEHKFGLFLWWLTECSLT